MNKKIIILMGVFFGISSVSYCASVMNDKPEQDAPKNNDDQAKSVDTPKSQSPSSDLAAQDDPALVKAVEEALDALKKSSPVVQEDSLRVWKNFKASSKPVNYTYRFWGRQLILWLKENKNMVFHSEQDVGNVFKVLYHKKLISSNAVVVLMVDAWGHLVYLEGSPDWEKRKENLTPGGEVAPDGVNKKMLDTPV